MFCIAAFIIFAVLGIFSVRYRTLAKKSWGCVLRKITFKPCDISVQEEIKSRLVGKFIFTKPRLARFINRWASTLAFIFVALSVWSLFSVFNSGLNLFVYDTCNPNNPESCALAGEGCGITSGKPGFWLSLKEGQVITWAKDDVLTFIETISRIPNRLKTWDATSYVSELNTYYKPFDSQKPIALEIIDPGCKFCAKLFGNIKETGFADRYNLTYFVYPIPDHKVADGYRFPNSFMIASYLEALKKYPLSGIDTPSDWQILEKVFTGKDVDNISYQIKFNTTYTSGEAEDLLLTWLADMGYTESERQTIQKMAHSDEIKSRLSQQRTIVEDKIQTIKIPTIMFDGRRYDRAVEPEKLR
jgi:hypothetical protein